MKTKIINQYKGFINTPNLWDGSAIFNLKQFELPLKDIQISNTGTFNEVRLGKRVEQFFDFQIKNSSDCKLLKSNIQIKNEKITIGELDVLLQNGNQLTHVELVYKFYLYDPNINSENKLDKWIGPNRRDALVYKLNKLKDKQLPLLYSKHCKPVLDSLKLNIENIQQEVCFKAQLFIPFNTNNIDVAPLSINSVYGVYISFSDYEILKGNEFYIPQKLDWLITPYSDAVWLDYNTAKTEIEYLINKKRSPLCWLKTSDNTLKKCFVTFW